MAAKLRLPLVFVLAFACLAALAGERLTRPSEDNHYAYLAGGWLEGRLHLEGKPPHRNDWGRITTLEFRDGRTFRGFPCRTDSCNDAIRDREAETWRGMDGAWVNVPRREIVKRTNTWYVTFPPAPAVVMLPLVAMWGLAFWDVLFTAVAGALIPVVLVAFLDRVRGHSSDHLWVAAAWTVASPACFVAAHGSVWFTAQVLGALFMVLAIAAAWELRRPGWAGLWLALLVATRPPAAIGVLVFLAWEWWRAGRPRPAAFRVLVPVGLVGLALAGHNYARFENVFELGHRYLDIAWQSRMQEYGLLSGRYLGRNLHCMFLLTPKWQGGSLRLSIHGMSLLLASPWVLAWPLSRTRFTQRWALVAAALAAAIPGLLYQNTGQIQVSYRFALDWLPLALIGIALGGGARHRLFQGAVLWGAAIQLYGAWLFKRAAGQLFGLGSWPYGSG